MSARPDGPATDAHGIPPVGRVRQSRRRSDRPTTDFSMPRIPADRPTVDGIPRVRDDRPTGGFPRVRGDQAPRMPGDRSTSDRIPRIPADRPTDGIPRMPGPSAGRAPEDLPPTGRIRSANGFRPPMDQPPGYGPPYPTEPTSANGRPASGQHTNPNGRPFPGDSTNPHGYRPYPGDSTNPNGYRPYPGDSTNPNGYRPFPSEPAMPNGYPPPRPPDFSGPDYGMPPPSGIPYGAPYGTPPGRATPNGHSRESGYREATARESGYREATARESAYRQPGPPPSYAEPGRTQPPPDFGRPGPGYNPYGNHPDPSAEPPPRGGRGRMPDDRAITPHETGRWSSSRGAWMPAESREEPSDFAIERFEETSDLRRTTDRSRNQVIDAADWTERLDQRPEWHPHTWDDAPTSRSTDWSESPLPPPRPRNLDPERERDPVASELMGEAVPSGTITAALAPLIWFGLAIVAYLIALFVFNDPAERAEAIDAGIKSLPWLGVASTMSVGLALAFRWIGAGWRAGGLGFAAAVVSGTLTTVLNSLFFG